MVPSDQLKTTVKAMNPCLSASSWEIAEAERSFKRLTRFVKINLSDLSVCIRKRASHSSGGGEGLEKEKDNSNLAQRYCPPAAKKCYTCSKKKEVKSIPHGKTEN